MAAQTSPLRATRETVLIDYVASWLAESRITTCTRFGGRTPRAPDGLDQPPARCRPCLSSTWPVFSTWPRQATIANSIVVRDDIMPLAVIDIRVLAIRGNRRQPKVRFQVT